MLDEWLRILYIAGGLVVSCAALLLGCLTDVSCSYGTLGFLGFVSWCVCSPFLVPLFLGLCGAWDVVRDNLFGVGLV